MDARGQVLEGQRWRRIRVVIGLVKCACPRLLEAKERSSAVSSTKAHRETAWPETQAMPSLYPHWNLDGTGGKLAIPSRSER
jgi:hypothetical protein